MVGRRTVYGIPVGSLTSVAFNRSRLSDSTLDGAPVRCRKIALRISSDLSNIIPQQ
jgi:hypothetical protein